MSLWTFIVLITSLAGLVFFFHSLLRIAARRTPRPRRG